LATFFLWCTLHKHPTNEQSFFIRMQFSNTRGSGQLTSCFPVPVNTMTDNVCTYYSRVFLNISVETFIPQNNKCWQCHPIQNEMQTGVLIMFLWVVKSCTLLDSY
jgi:hypothetical protein